jgi:hypothetical protein
MGPVAEDAFVPTDIDQDIDVPLSMMLCMPPLLRVGHVPFAVGSMLGTAPLPRGVPLEEPLDEPLEEPPEEPLPELLLDGCEPLDPPEEEPELDPPPLEVPPVLPELLPEDPLPALASESSDELPPPNWVPGEDPPHPTATPNARVRSVASEPSSKPRPRWELMGFPFSFFVFQRLTLRLYRCSDGDGYQHTH